MIKQIIKKYIIRPKYLSEVKQQDSSKKFELLYNDSSIGYLEFKENSWYFEYSEWFKKQNRIVPLIEFPDINKKYSSTELWSFFISRIPSKINRKDKSPNENKNELDLSELLELFGQRSINNPFVLKPS